MGRVNVRDVAGVDEPSRTCRIVEFPVGDPESSIAPGRRIPPACCWLALPAPARPYGARGRRANQRPFFTISVPLRRDCRRCRCFPRPRYVRAGQKKLPCIIFIDEIDASPSSWRRPRGGNDEREQTLEPFAGARWMALKPWKAGS